VAPVALAGAIIPGVAKFMVMLSAHADVFGAGATVSVGLMVVLPSSMIPGCIVPIGGLLGISGVESGIAAAFVDAPPGVELHVVVDELPSGDAGGVVPVVLPTLGVEMVLIACGVDGVVAVGLPVVDVEVADVAEGEQVTTVPDIVGSRASGTGASVVSGTPD
jgi:hypothetical protein